MSPFIDRLFAQHVALWTIVFSIVAAQVHAIDTFWSNNRGDGSGTFSVATNWSPSVPGLNDVAHFGMTTSNLDPKTYTVAFTANATTNSLIIEDDRVTFALNGHTYTNSHVPFTTSTRIGDQPGRNGGLSVTNGLLDVNGVLFIGAGGTGDLTVTQSGNVQSDFFARVGSIGSSGTVAVNGDGSQWIHNGELSVGWGGTGVMNITDSALVQNGAGLVADVVTSATGTVNVSGVNSRGVSSRWINSGSLIVGDTGHGVLNITAGGQVSAASAVIGNQSGAVGEVNIDGPGSLLSSSDTIFVSSFGPGTGTLTVVNGGTVSATNGVFVRLLGTLRGDGEIIGNVSNIGVVAPGTSPGTLHVTGSFMQGVQGTLGIELAGATPGSQFDTLDISGSATLNGTLSVSLLGGFTPASGDVFEIIHADQGIFGGFTSLSLPALPGELGWAIVYTGQGTFLSVQGALLPGDFNANGVVDVADYVLWRNGGPLANDNTPGVQLGDYDVWRAHFGQTVSGGAISIATVVVPEPANVALLLFATIILLTCRQYHDCV